MAKYTWACFFLRSSAILNRSLSSAYAFRLFSLRSSLSELSFINSSFSTLARLFYEIVKKKEPDPKKYRVRVLSGNLIPLPRPLSRTNAELGVQPSHCLALCWTDITSKLPLLVNRTVIVWIGAFICLFFNRGTNGLGFGRFPNFISIIVADVIVWTWENTLAYHNSSWPYLQSGLLLRAWQEVGTPIHNYWLLHCGPIGPATTFGWKKPIFFKGGLASPQWLPVEWGASFHVTLPMPKKTTKNTQIYLDLGVVTTKAKVCLEWLRLPSFHECFKGVNLFIFVRKNKITFSFF